jgi:hypothetical protein
MMIFTLWTSHSSFWGVVASGKPRSLGPGSNLDGLAVEERGEEGEARSGDASGDGKC